MGNCGYKYSHEHSVLTFYKNVLTTDNKVSSREEHEAFLNFVAEYYNKDTEDELIKSNEKFRELLSIFERAGVSGLLLSLDSGEHYAPFKSSVNANLPDVEDILSFNLLNNQVDV